MKTVRVGDWLEVSAQFCRAEFGVGFLVSVMEPRHFSASVLIGCFDFSVDLWGVLGTEVGA